MELLLAVVVLIAVLALWTMTGPAAVVNADGGSIRVRLRLPVKLLCFAADLRIPAGSLAGVSVVDRADALDRVERRTGGTSLPGLLHAGRFHGRSGAEFLAVQRTGRVLQLRVVGYKYSFVVLSVADPDVVADTLQPFAEAGRAARLHQRRSAVEDPHPKEIVQNWDTRAEGRVVPRLGSRRRAGEPPR